MWANLSDDIRKAIDAAGETPQSMQGLDDAPEHRDLFFQYFADNCSDADTQNLWDSYWWLAYRDLNPASYRSDRERRSVDLDLFWQGFGPDGASPIAWPEEIGGWFAQNEAWNQALEAAWQPAWDAEDDPSGPEWDAYEALIAERRAWVGENPVPLRAAFDYAGRVIGGWYKAYFDEVARIRGLAMTYADLDLDYIDSLNKYNLDALAAGDGVTCVGYGPYVLIGEFPPGYMNAVASYDQSWWGTVTMTARGKGLDPGKVTVTGCDTANQAYFKEAFRRVSKKAVKYE